MANIQHKALVTADLHVPGFVQAADPALTPGNNVRSGIYWIDSSGPTGTWTLKVRNAGNTAWETVSRFEFTNFDPKTAMVAADLMILEDSEASYAKKKITFANLITSLTPSIEALVGLSPGYIYGGMVSNNTTDVVNDLDFASGKFRDATDAYDITCGAMTKRIDAVFAEGTNQGGLDTGTIGATATLVYLWAIGGSGKNGDYLFSKSSTAPTMPTGYTYKRLIGGRRWGGTSWTKFNSHGTGDTRDTYYDAQLTVVTSFSGTGSGPMAFTDVSCSEWMPVTSREGLIYIFMRPATSAATSNVYVCTRPKGSTNSDVDSTAFWYVRDASGDSGHGAKRWIPVDSTQTFQWVCSTGNGAGSVYVHGFRERL